MLCFMQDRIIVAAWQRVMCYHGVLTERTEFRWATHPHQARTDTTLSAGSPPPPRDGLPLCLTRGHAWDIDWVEGGALVGSICMPAMNM